jgi:hypothetical protein
LRAAEGRAVTVTLRRHELCVEACRDLRVVLCLPGQRAADCASIGVCEENGQLPQMVAEVAIEAPARLISRARGPFLAARYPEGRSSGMAGMPTITRRCRETRR